MLLRRLAGRNCWLLPPLHLMSRTHCHAQACCARGMLIVLLYCGSRYHFGLYLALMGAIWHAMFMPIMLFPTLYEFVMLLSEAN